MLVSLLFLLAPNSETAAMPTAVPTPVPVVFENSAPAPTTAPTPTPTPLPIAAAPSPIEVQLGARLPTPIANQILEKDTADLAKILAASWDNELQTFFEPEIGIPADLRHLRRHIKVAKIAAQGFGSNVFYVEYRQNGEAGNIVRARIWALRPATAQMAVGLYSYEPKPNIGLGAMANDMARLNALTPADFTPLNGCEIWFRRRGGSFVGETLAGACKAPHADGRVLNITEQHEISEKIWDISDIGIDARGQRVFGALDNSPSHMVRANMFTCWASQNQTNSSVFAEGLKVHDQGGVAIANFNGAAPIRLRLRNIDWPIGTNRPSLTLYFLQGNDDLAQIFAWTEPNANRIALSYGNYQASCTRD